MGFESAEGVSKQLQESRTEVVDTPICDRISEDDYQRRAGVSNPGQALRPCEHVAPPEAPRWLDLV